MVRKPKVSSDVDRVIVKLLRCCKKVGYTKVAILQRWDEIERSKYWNMLDARGSIFVFPSIRIDNYPAIWDIARKLGIHAGAGNLDQVQTTLGGVCEPQSWKLVENKWVKVVL